MNNITIGALALAGLAVAVTIWPSDEPPQSALSGVALAAVRLPEALSENAKFGQTAFDAKCASCHGSNAAGKDGVAPPLVHKIYEPSHHGDDSFYLAAQNGVRAHHWPFGNMPPVEGLTRADMASIIAYVRELQRANGIN